MKGNLSEQLEKEYIAELEFKKQQELSTQIKELLTQSQLELNSI